MELVVAVVVVALVVVAVVVLVVVVVADDESVVDGIVPPVVVAPVASEELSVSFAEAGTHVPARPSGAAEPYFWPDSQSAFGKLQKPVAGWHTPVAPLDEHWASSWHAKGELQLPNPNASPHDNANRFT